MERSLLDTNVLVHAIYRRSPLHAAAAALVDRGLRERDLHCVAPQNLIEFAAVVTRSRFVDPPLPVASVYPIVDKLYRSRRLSKVYPRRGTVMRAMREGTALGITGPLWYDLFLAATMRDAGVFVIITENVDDFKRFPFLTTQGIEEAARTP
jgi:predicted nucleic acid-binding protein